MRCFLQDSHSPPLPLCWPQAQARWSTLACVGAAAGARVDALADVGMDIPTRNLDYQQNTFGQHMISSDV
jgi:hypothetical protein